MIDNQGESARQAHQYRVKITMSMLHSLEFSHKFNNMIIAIKLIGDYK